jgi:hypothetical protein
VAELVDALDSKSSSARSAGSIPARGTIPAFRRLEPSLSGRSSLGDREGSSVSFPAEPQELRLILDDRLTGRILYRSLLLALVQFWMALRGC